MKFDSPLELCPVCNEYVLLDQTQGECAREHECGRRDCPLAAAFTGHDFRHTGPGQGREEKDPGG